MICDGTFVSTHYVKVEDVEILVLHSASTGTVNSNLYFFMMKSLLGNTIHLYNNLKFGAVDNQLIPRTDIYIIIIWCVCNQ